MGWNDNEARIETKNNEIKISMIVLIDNDKLIHYSWKLRAKHVGEHLECFYSVDEFLRSKMDIPKECKIYIDSDLENNLKGEVLAEEIFRLGFKNLWLATGYEDIPLEKYPWLSGLITKKPPF